MFYACLVCFDRWEGLGVTGHAREAPLAVLLTRVSFMFDMSCFVQLKYACLEVGMVHSFPH